MAKFVPHVHNYALKIPWAQVGWGAQLWHAPKRGLNRTRGFPFGYFSFSFRTLISGNTVRQHYCRTHDAATKEAESYVHHGTPRWITITSKIFALILFLSFPLEGTCQTVLLFSYHTTCIILLRCTFLNKQCIALDHYRILYSFIYICSFMTFSTRTLWYGQYAKGLSIPHNTA